MRQIALNVVIFTAVSWFIWYQQSWGQTTQPAVEQAVRLIDLPDGSAELDTQIVRYVNDAGVSVDLVAAVHVADRSYYEQLNAEFAQYDAVMFEMIMPRGAVPPPPGQFSDSGLSTMQRMIKNLLALDFQLDVIDYTRPNFIHGDLTVEEFHQLQDERNESMFGMIMRAAMSDMANESGLDGFQLLGALASPDRAGALKRLLARQFAHIDQMAEIIEGPDGSVLVTERNRAAVDAALKAIAGGNRQVAIFYGAAHIKGIGDMLEEKGFRRDEVRWVTAWTIPPLAQSTTRPATRPSKPAARMQP